MMWKINMADLAKKIYMYGTAPGSIVDGPGIRFSVFVQGCTHHCPGCHNKDSQAHKQVNPMTVGQILNEIQEAKSCTGVTFTGGEPFEQADALGELAIALKEKNYNIWAYSGYRFEDLVKIAQGKDTPAATDYCNKEHSQGVLNMLNNIDVLVDGRFDQNLKSYDALYRGSTNQRLIDMKKTLMQNNMIEWSQEFVVPERPSS